MDFFQWYITAWVFAFGLCVGSFLNVVIWRLPQLGREVEYEGKKGRLSLNWPPSHCPRCSTGIRWYHNVPVLGWIFLGGRCASCRKTIAVRYPLVELGTGLLFAAVYLADFAGHWRADFVSLSADHFTFGLQLLLVAGLLAASGIDADLFIIPLQIPHLLIALGLIAAAVTPQMAGREMAIPSIAGHPTWAWPIAGCVLGLVIANVLLRLKIIPQSFPEIMKESEKDVGEHLPVKAEAEAEVIPPVKGVAALLVAAVLVLLGAGMVFFRWGAMAGSMAMLLAGFIIFMLGILPRETPADDLSQEVMDEISKPHARLEIMKEILFLAFPAAGVALGVLLPLPMLDHAWSNHLLGAALGALAGGGVVWAIRILGTLGFGKEAMGLGDVHLMAGVGAILGWKMAVLAFFIAPFFGLLWAVVRMAQRKPNLLPYGPWLSAASLVAMVAGERIVNAYIQAMFGAP